REPLERRHRYPGQDGHGRDDENRLRTSACAALTCFGGLVRGDGDGGVNDLHPRLERRRHPLELAPPVPGEVEGDDRLPVQRRRKDADHARRPGEPGAHAAESPPSTSTVAPVTHRASSEARYATAPATSSASPSRPSG